MKHFLVFSLFVLCVSAMSASCAPSPTSSEIPKAMVVSPDSIHLTSIVDTVGTSVSLNCGCAFGFHVTAISGSTDKIQFVVSTPDTATGHTVRFTAAPGTPSGTYSAVYEFIGGDNNAMHHTVNVSLVF